MSKTFNLYCDESTHLIHDGHPYMLLSYISIAYPQIRLAKEEIKAIKRKFNYTEELKWTNVHSATYKVYAELLDWFFMNDLEFRAVVVNKSMKKEPTILLMISILECIFNCFIRKLIFKTDTMCF